jgi:antitoxin (DNA-binding transcriptional repressor) of toxin-antitoxin stability system
VAVKSVPAGEARKEISRILSDAEGGQCTLIIRNSKPTAAVVPAQLADLLPLVHAIMCDLGESIQLSRDSDILVAFENGQRELERGDIEWYEV